MMKSSLFWIRWIRSDRKVSRQSLIEMGYTSESVKTYLSLLMRLLLMYPESVT